MSQTEAHHPAVASVPAEGEMSPVVIRQLSESICLFSRPFERAGIEAGVRMSVVKTSAGLVIYNPTELDAPTRRELQKLGQDVTHIIAPNLVHHLWLEQMASAYPAAKIVAPKGLMGEHSGITPSRFVEVSNAPHCVDFGDSSVDLAYFPDVKHEEILFFHSPSKTMFVADLLWNLPATEQYQKVPHSTGILQSIGNAFLKPDAAAHKMLAWGMTKRSSEFDKEMIKVFDLWQPTTIVPEHGDVITTGAMDKLRNAWSWAWPQSKK